MNWSPSELLGCMLVNQMSGAAIFLMIVIGNRINA
jgi:hypothetical protein